MQTKLQVSVCMWIGWIKRYVVRQIETIDRCIHVDRWIDRQIDRCIDRQMCIQMDRQIDRQIYVYTGWPRNKTERSIQSIFRALLSSTITFFTLLDRASISHYNNIQIIKFGWKTFHFMRHLLWTVIFGICPISRVSRHDDKLMANPKNDSR